MMQVCAVILLAMSTVSASWWAGGLEVNAGSNILLSRLALISLSFAMPTVQYFVGKRLGEAITSEKSMSDVAVLGACYSPITLFWVGHVLISISPNPFSGFLYLFTRWTFRVDTLMHFGNTEVGCVMNMTAMFMFPLVAGMMWVQEGGGAKEAPGASPEEVS